MNVSSRFQKPMSQKIQKDDNADLDHFLTFDDLIACYRL